MRKAMNVSSLKPVKSRAKRRPTPEQIQLRAYEIYVERSGAPGNALQDWVQAERELLQMSPKTRRVAKAKAA